MCAITTIECVLWHHLRAILQAVLMILILNMCSEITLLKLLPHLTGASELSENAVIELYQFMYC